LLQKLNCLKRYRRFSVALLLALYAFAATPVYFWHQHHDDTASASKKQPVPNDAESHFKAVCKICTDHHTVYDDTFFLVSTAPLRYQQAHNNRHRVTAVTVFAHRYSNKGPPAEA
jgi:isocitrate dehydrogenase kinase/phosphatase